MVRVERNAQNVPLYTRFNGSELDFSEEKTWQKLMIY